jgi:hypothetical protein
MKKLMLLLAVACLIFVSCGTRTEKAIESMEETNALTPEQEAMFENWENWDALELDQKVVLVGEMKAFLDECKAKCEKKCEGNEEVEKEMCPVKKAECEAFKAKWEAFETLELDVQKECIDMVIAHMSKCCKDKKEGEGCCKEKKEGCCKEKKEACNKEKEGCSKE